MLSAATDSESEFAFEPFDGGIIQLLSPEPSLVGTYKSESSLKAPLLCNQYLGMFPSRRQSINWTGVSELARKPGNKPR